MRIYIWQLNKFYLKTKNRVPLCLLTAWFRIFIIFEIINLKLRTQIVNNLQEKMAKTWTIVIFTDENTVEVVPTNWIQNNKCYWPSPTSDKMISAIKNHDAPNDSWPSYSIRLVRKMELSVNILLIVFWLYQLTKIYLLHCRNVILISF